LGSNRSSPSGHSTGRESCRESVSAGRALTNCSRPHDRRGREDSWGRARRRRHPHAVVEKHTTGGCLCQRRRWRRAWPVEGASPFLWRTVAAPPHRISRSPLPRPLGTPRHPEKMGDDGGTRPGRHGRIHTRRAVSSALSRDLSPSTAMLAFAGVTAGACSAAPSPARPGTVPRRHQDAHVARTLWASSATAEVARCDAHRAHGTSGGAAAGDRVPPDREPGGWRAGGKVDMVGLHRSRPTETRASRRGREQADKAECWAEVTAKLNLDGEELGQARRWRARREADRLDGKRIN